MKTYNVPEEVWRERMNNLMERRKVQKISNSSLPTYCELINRCHIGKSVLDVGCGSMAIKDCLPPGTRYVGIDPYPLSLEVIPVKIEDYHFPDTTFETVYAFATLDGVQDLEIAVNNMKRLCSHNIVILTGINIPPDKYHTIEVNETKIDRIIGWPIGWGITYREVLAPNVILKEYTRTTKNETIQTKNIP